MMATWFTGNGGFGEEKWGRMLGLSLLFHIVIFSTVLFVPKNEARYPSLKDRVYQVELVSPPSGRALRGGSPGGAAVEVKKTTQILRTKTQRITVKEKEKVPVVAKRVSPKLEEKPEQRITSSSGLIEEALSRIERKVTEEEKIQPTPTPTPTETGENEEPEGEGAVSAQGGEAGIPGASSETGKGIALYQMEIEYAIKNNWTYPVALVNTKGGEGPEAVVNLTVRNDGKIMKHSFKKRSHDILFDDSVQKAIEKSDPLPPFPSGYKKSYDEVEISFSLKDLV